VFRLYLTAITHTLSGGISTTSHGGNMRRKLGFSMGGIALVLALAYLVMALRSQPVPVHPFFAGQQGVQVIAHQGGERLRPSNTMVSFQHAMELGVDILEMDIHATQDGVLVAIHDDTVDRTTDGAGKVKELTFAEIQQLDAGHYWSNDDGVTYPYRGQGIQISALSEVFEAFPGMRMNIEIKQVDPPIAEPLCQMIRHYGQSERVLVASFRQEAMLAFRAACPEVATSMVQAEIQPFWIWNQFGLAAVHQTPANAHAFQVPLRSRLPVLGQVDVLSPRFMRAAHRHNIQVHAWTIDDPEVMSRLIEMGIDGIITDRPDLMLELLGR
jgi:glycerophosphoryl diester phosphodiesterase